jgi:uncharacterized protein (TIGR03435 family)
VSYSRVIGGETALNEVYDIAAVAPDGATKEELMQMLQNMLVQRLGLKCHMEERPTEIYALSVGVGPLKLTPATEEAPSRFLYNPGEFKQQSASLANFVFFLTGQMDREVLDVTGLEGQYAFNLDWKRENAENWVQGPRGMMHDPQTIFRVVKTIGLKMEAKKLPLKHLIVDHVNKEPTPN